jgi:hypothetical protein
LNEERGYELLYLLQSSPGPDPIEETFLQLKGLPWKSNAVPARVEALFASGYV